MKVVLLLTGKTKQDFVQKGMNEYVERLKHYVSFEINVIPEIRNAANLSFDQQKEKEGELILNNIQPGDFVVLLDERGQEFSSLSFATYIEKKMHLGSKRLVFVIGGPYGFSVKVYEKAQEKLSLSQMTFSHQLIRLIFVEQLYRAMTILNNGPYHHE